jgi:hypothetical protein
MKIEWAAGLVASVLTGGALAADRPWYVYDANGLPLGRHLTIVDGQGFATNTMQVKLLGRKFVVFLGNYVTPEGQVAPTKLDFRSDQVYFATPDCSGKSYLANTRAGVSYGAVTVSPSGMVTMYPPESENLVSLKVLSILTQDKGCFTGNQFVDYFIPAVAAVDVTQKFARPFTLR